MIMSVRSLLVSLGVFSSDWWTGVLLDRLTAPRLALRISRQLSRWTSTRTSLSTLSLQTR